jgi:hypothetical protein
MIITKYESIKKEELLLFFEKKDKEMSNIDWAKWGGWFDTDGCFSIYKKEFKKPVPKVSLSLKDRSPIELFSKTFQTSLSYLERFNPSTKVLEKRFNVHLRNEKAIWFMKNIKKFINNKNQKIEEIFNYLNVPYGKEKIEQTREEFIAWLTCAFEGDGTFLFSKERKVAFATFYNSNVVLLEYITNKSKEFNIVKFLKPYNKGTKGSLGKKDRYQMTISTKMENVFHFYKIILPYMTMDRKRNKVIDSIEFLEQRIKEKNEKRK